jgi:hypothetical protein
LGPLAPRRAVTPQKRRVFMYTYSMVLAEAQYSYECLSFN